MSSKKFLMGFDIGTQGSKGIIIDFEGNLAAYSYCSHDVIHEKANWSEHDALKTWWGDFIEVSRDLLDKSKVSPNNIMSIGISGILPCMLPVDEVGQPLRNAILYGIDTRAEKEIQILNERIGETRIREITKTRISAQSVGAKILWYKRNEPDLFKKTKKFLSSTGFIVSKLTGKYVIDRSTANETTPLYNFETATWDEEMCEAVGITKEQLPDIFEAHEVAGTITEQAARQTGLIEGTPVITGTGDFLAEMLSMGGKDGDTLVIYGSTMLIFHISKNPVFIEQLNNVIYPMDKLYLIGGGTASSASITKWFRDEFGSVELEIEEKDGINAYKQLSDSASKISAGSNGLVFLPYFAGERSPIWDPNARGLLMGLTLFHKKAHIYRSILEGTCYSIRHHIDIMRSEGLDITNMISTGGGIKSRLWTQIMSDVTRSEQLCFSNDMGSPAGDAYLAGIGIGAFEGMSVMNNKWIKNSWIVKPHIQESEIYDKYYEIYRKTYPDIKKQMNLLAGLESF